MLVTDVEMSTLVNEVQSSKASSPILVTDVGMTMLVSEVHPRKANSPMLVKDLGIATLVTSSLFTVGSSRTVALVAGRAALYDLRVR